MVHDKNLFLEWNQHKEHEYAGSFWQMPRVLIVSTYGIVITSTRDVTTLLTQVKYLQSLQIPPGAEICATPMYNILINPKTPSLSLFSRHKRIAKSKVYIQACTCTRYTFSHAVREDLLVQAIRPLYDLKSAHDEDER
jgi:hypothetical protein